MPLLKLQTNITIHAENKTALLQQLSQRASEWLDKPEAYVQIVLEDQVAMLFAGTTEPTAMIEIRSLGFYGHTPGEISKALCQFLEAGLDIPCDRIFINFFDLARKDWGWNGKTFE